MDDFSERCIGRYKIMNAENEARKSKGIHDYSLIASLLKPSTEVALHSNFLFSMLNPSGLHYQGDTFLKLFLDELPSSALEGFDVRNAWVKKEEFEIDLLICDGEKALVIENKINAVDQPLQISRYIGTVQKKLFAQEANLSGRVAVIYLSARRQQPSSESQSLFGFALEDGVLRWEGYDGPAPHADIPRLEVGSEIPFHHFAYFPTLVRWAERCLKVAPQGGIRNAFEEYRLVLNRLENPKSWRNVMGLDSFAMSLPEADQQEMYSFMVQSVKALDRFIAARLYAGLVNIFGYEAVSNPGCFKPFDEGSLLLWLGTTKGDGKKNIGFTFDGPGQEQYGFVLGKSYAYLGLMGDKPLWEGGKDSLNRIAGGSVSPLLREKIDGVYRLLDEIRSRAEQLGIKGKAGIPQPLEPA